MKSKTSVTRSRFKRLVRFLKMSALGFGVFYFVVCLVGSAKITVAICATICLYEFVKGFLDGRLKSKESNVTDDLQERSN